MCLGEWARVMGQEAKTSVAAGSFVAIHSSAAAAHHGIHTKFEQSFKKL